MKKLLISKNIFAGIIGNIIEHYGSALFCLLAPFISPLFFPVCSPLDGLILTYGLLCLGIIFKPLGALLFGYIADSGGRKKALILALFGSAITCLGFALVPTYSKMGMLAPLGVAILKALQVFFSAGETPSGALFVLDQTSKKSIMSSIYDASSIGGILFASFGVFILSRFDLIDGYWRILFLFGSLSAIAGLYLKRKKNFENSSFIEIKNRKTNFEMQNGEMENKEKIGDIFKILRDNFFAFASITVISGFSYSLYYFSLVFFNGYLSLISNISNAQSMKMNTLLLILDFCALPLFGFIASRLTKEKVMLFSSLLIAIISLPLFSLLNNASIYTAFGVRLIFVLSGVVFSAPLHHLAIDMAPIKHRSKIISMGYAFGSQLIGLPSCSIGFYLFKKTGNIFSPAIYLSLYALLSFIFIFKFYLDKKSLPQKG